MNNFLTINFEKVSVYRDKVLVLSDINLRIKPGEFVYVLGKTGCGKSSLMKTLYAELQIEDGKAHILEYNLDGIKNKEIPFLRRKLGIVFQDFQLLTDRTVHANMEFVMKATGWQKKDKIKKRSDEVLNLVGIPTKGFKMPHELSGGEQQRVCIARSLVNSPEIILADEPTGNLDPETSADIIKLFHQIHINGTTVLLASHNHYLIDKYPARKIILDRGKIIEDRG